MVLEVRLKKRKNLETIMVSRLFCGAAGQIRTADLILTKSRRAFQPLLYKAFRRVFCPKRIRSQPVCSIVPVRSFPRVGHGVGQNAFRTRTRGVPPTAANRAAPDTDLVLFVSIQNISSQRVKQNMLGHYDAGFTLRTYTHATRQKQDEAAQTMGSFMAQVM